MTQKYDIDFTRPPKRGTVIHRAGQHYRLIDAKPYTRKDGTPSTLLTWEAYCCECGAHFQAKSGLRHKALYRRCQCHRTAGKPVKWSRKALALLAARTPGHLASESTAPSSEVTQ